MALQEALPLEGADRPIHHLPIVGADGAAGLLAIRRHGGRTYAQDESTSAVFGMPRRAIELGAAMTVESPAAIGAALAAGGAHVRG